MPHSTIFHAEFESRAQPQSKVELGNKELFGSPKIVP